MAEQQVVEQEKAFDPLAHMKARNEADQAAREGKQIREAPKVDNPAPKVDKEPEKSTQSHEAVRVPRSVRRQMNALLRQVGELEGRLKERDTTTATPSKAEDDPEPQRAAFATEGEFQRALGRWDARQEAKAELSKRDEKQSETEQSKAWQEHCDRMQKKAVEDSKLIPDWDTVAKSASDDNAIEFVPSEHPTLSGLIAASDVQAFVLYHFAKHSDEFRAMLDLTKDQGAQIRAFHRLEGRIEKLYTPEKKQEPAQGSESSKEDSQDRTHPAEAAHTAGRTAVDRDVHKPKPSAEVGGRGGSAPPESPQVGTKAWMELRNQEQYGRRS